VEAVNSDSSEKDMRIAITAVGTSLDAAVDPRFGRAQYILIVEDGKLVEAVDNSKGINAFSGAGIQAGKLLADKKVNVLLTGNCGPNAFKALQAAGIRVGVEQSGTVQEALERFQQGAISFADQPNVEGHW
jgi:predicted Fe-Mo cluster-binding NifX family protein